MYVKPLSGGQTKANNGGHSSYHFALRAPHPVVITSDAADATTPYVVQHPRPNGPNLALLLASKATHTEGAPIMYQSPFWFDDVHVMHNFLAARTAAQRRWLERVQVCVHRESFACWPAFDLLVGTGLRAFVVHWMPERTAFRHVRAFYAMAGAWLTDLGPEGVSAVVRLGDQGDVRGLGRCLKGYKGKREIKLAEVEKAFLKTMRYWVRQEARAS